MKFSTAVLFLGAAQASLLFNGEKLSTEEHEFLKFLAKHNKSYGTKAEFEFRLAQFKETFAKMVAHNASNGTSTVGINQFADLTAAEMKRLTGFQHQPKAEDNVKILPTDNLADEVNWVEQGAVTPVKNQGMCGSCWAFSTTGAIEGAEFIASGTLTSFSEQQLVDCATGTWGNMGCNGGLMDYAFRYVEKYPLETEADYPYKGVDGKCAYDASKGVGKVKGFADVKPNSPDQLKAAIAKGPVSVAIEADQYIFQGYTGGVITSSTCGQMLDHGVLAVGYGSENGQEYFLVKNSWGPSWGANGYVKIGAGSSNVCGILSQPSYPTE